MSDLTTKRCVPTIEEIMEADNDLMGWCVKCQDFTTDSCEPDARRYTCDLCGESSVYGAMEIAMMM